MSVFGKTRAAAEYAARHGRTELARARAVVLLERLDACEVTLADDDTQLRVTIAGLLRSLVLAARDVVGPAWLEASSDDPDVATFTALQATASPPDPDRIDEICSRVLWARFARPGATRDGTGPVQPADGSGEGDMSHARRTD